MIHFMRLRAIITLAVAPLLTGCLGVSAIDTSLGITSCSAIPGIVDSTRPQLSPDGTKIVYASKAALDGATNGVATFSFNIWVMNVDGSSRTALTRNSAARLDSLNPRWSPNGLSIVFESKMPLNAATAGWNGTALPSSNIWTMSATGTSLTALTQNTLPKLDSITPVYAPSGLKIAFVSKMDTALAWNTVTSQSYNLFEMNPDGTGLAALTLNTGVQLHTHSPVYSPDSVTIAVSTNSSTGGAWNTLNTFSANIATLPSGGGALTFWTNNTNPYLDSIQPVFYPDATGSQIAYASLRDIGGANNTFGTNSYNIWITNTVGPVHTPLTSNTNAQLDSYGPAFSPDMLTVVFHTYADATGATNGTASYSANIQSVPSAAGAITPLTANTAIRMDSYYPLYNAAGDTLVFFSNMSSAIANAGSTASTNIWTMTPAGASITALTDDSQSCINL